MKPGLPGSAGNLLDMSWKSGLPVTAGNLDMSSRLYKDIVQEIMPYTAPRNVQEMYIFSEVIHEATMSLECDLSSTNPFESCSRKCNCYFSVSSSLTLFPMGVDTLHLAILP